jgi:hypothetical protein
LIRAGPIICLGLALLTTGEGQASGCFGGQPEILPRQASTNLPANSQVRIATRDAASVAWFGPDGHAVHFGERKVGHGRSAARVLTPGSELMRGTHTLRTTDPDMDVRFEVAQPVDEIPPSLHGSLILDGHFAPEADSTCPTNIWIRIALPVPQDDRTEDGSFSYLVFLGGGREETWRNADLLVHAESVADGRARFRIGETGCGCIPRAELRRCTRYRVAVVAVDAAGNLSPQSLSGEVTIPGCP